ncbi:metal ABC transporter substrate-binding protein [Nocardioides sp. LHG3406-4]|uniref:metal ABC transporter substrate-binding protein n=1 Tax=Nocardioides sp. LHG3406-4 TaxID=2804575 RepID=UPI003CEF30BC
MKSQPLTLGAVLAGAALLSSCAAFSASDTEGVQAAAAFYPLEYAAARVGGDHVTVDNLTQPGQEPHDLELSIRQTAVVAAADLVVLEEGFQPAVDAAAEVNADGTVLDVSGAADLLPFDAHDHEGGHEEGPEEAHQEGHDHGSTDPHFWLDPLRLADVGDAIADALSEVDPGSEATYDANAASLRRDLEALDRDFAAGLESCDRDTVVVSHDAFGYLRKYGLHLEPITGLTPGAEPTPADVQRLQELITEEGITTVFSETLASNAASVSLAHDLGIVTAVLDPLEGLASKDDDDDYLTIMRANLAALQKANGC